jgi:ABC-type branched-subunit amino acid transport system substrate-binding protein
MVLVLGSAVLPACDHGAPADAPTALVVVNVPLTDQPELAESLVQGAQLGAEEVNGKGGVRLADGSVVRLEVDAVDSGLSPITTRDNVRDAIDRGAVAVVDEGSGVDAAWTDARDVGMPIGIVYQGARSLIDPQDRPNVYRIAPTDRGVAFRLAEYILPKGVKLGVITDDSAYGAAGAVALETPLSHNRDQIMSEVVVPNGSDPAPQVLKARNSGADSLLVWASPATLAEVIRAARSAGWKAPIYSALSAEDPLVRQRLSDHPEWLDGLTFAMSRLTAERGPAPFEAFRSAYESRFGPDKVGVRNAAGQEIKQLPDFPMYSYDFVRLLAKGMERAGTAQAGDALITAMEQVEVSGANGDERSFNENSHEGVIDDDVFFANFDDMTWTPVEDDPLSATLPKLPQTL